MFTSIGWLKTAALAVIAGGAALTAATAEAQYPRSRDGLPFNDQEEFREDYYGANPPPLERTRMWDDRMYLPRYGWRYYYLMQSDPSYAPLLDVQPTPGRAVKVVRERPPRRDLVAPDRAQIEVEPDGDLDVNVPDRDVTIDPDGTARLVPQRDVNVDVDASGTRVDVDVDEDPLDRDVEVKVRPAPRRLVVPEPAERWR